MVPANHLDHNETMLIESNFITNILPQAANMNRGAWLYTETLVECFRDVETLSVIGGAVFGYGDLVHRKDVFRSTHGVEYPVAFWKVIKGTTIHPNDGSRIAFWIPNDQEATWHSASKWVVSIAELESNLRRFGQAESFIGLSTAHKKHRPSLWEFPIGCDRS